MNKPVIKSYNVWLSLLACINFVLFCAYKNKTEYL